MTPDPAAPLLLFDSGVGGLSVLGKVRAALPDAPVMYVSDNAGLPYGTKTEAQIAARMSGLLGRLTERFARGWCALPATPPRPLRSLRCAKCWKCHVGTVPAIKPAAAMTRSGVIGLLGTEGDDPAGLCRPAGGGIRVRQAPAAPCRSRIGRCRRGQVARGPVDPAVFARAAAALRAMPDGAAIDTVVLACTHFAAGSRACRFRAERALH